MLQHLFISVLLAEYLNFAWLKWIKYVAINQNFTAKSIPVKTHGKDTQKAFYRRHSNLVLNLNLKITVQSLSWTFSSNATVILFQHLFTERRRLLACQTKYPSHLHTFRICSSPSLLRSCLNELSKVLLLQNGYPTGVTNYNVFLNRQQGKAKNRTTAVPKKEIILVQYLT